MHTSKLEEDVLVDAGNDIDEVHTPLPVPATQTMEWLRCTEDKRVPQAMPTQSVILLLQVSWVDYGNARLSVAQPGIGVGDGVA